MLRTPFLERSGSYVSEIRNYRKNSQKRGLRSFSKKLRYITATSLQKLTPDVKVNSWRNRGYTASILIVMKPRRCRAILFQKVDPKGFFKSCQNVGIGISTCKNVLVDLCIGMFCWLMLCPKRLQGKFPRLYTYSDWLNLIFSSAPDRLQYPGLVKLRQPNLNHMYYIIHRH